ncbi:MAG: YebC/PmpR family DNA-binding transcriptional regulator [Cyanobacteria bacterium J06648_11]
MSQSRWASIRLHKAKADAAKNATFTKLSRAIIAAARQGDPDPDSNFALRAAVQKARAAGLPSSNIERAIARGSGLGGDGQTVESLRYEGYGPGGVAVLLNILTDNRNRAAADVRAAFTKSGGNLGETGCVGYLFDRKGVIRIAGASDEDELVLAAAEAGGDDVAVDEDGADVICPYEAVESVARQLESAGVNVAFASVRWLPNTFCTVDDPAIVKQTLILIDKLEALDDVQAVFTNFTADERVLEEALGGTRES